eukprot:TRINITY_DN10004_c0_g1_i2.p1 TRINITY_DN10004_c0_g1~~TRINITY_DN10004_c0_g1_i2.p1  ORF type:complete len:158 (-),score=10.00 TRINITY_DN10004_c0_g1_i2:466-939(-)
MKWAHVSPIVEMFILHHSHQNSLFSRNRVCTSTKNPPPSLEPPSDPEGNYEVTSFGEAMIDFAKKHDDVRELLDVAACFVLFLNSRNGEDTPVVVNRKLSRYFRRAEDKPQNWAVVKQDRYNDFSALLAKEYSNAEGSIDVLSEHARTVEAAVQERI